MGRVSTIYRESCVVPPGIPTGEGSPTLPDPGSGGPGGGNAGGGNGGTGAAPGSCGPIDPNNPTDPTNANCSDPTFAANNPSICGNPVSLVISPSIASIPVAGTQQYTAYISQGGTNIPVSAGVTFTSGTTADATIVSSTGIATGVAAGTTIISATWHGYTAQAQLTVNALAGGDGPPGGPLCTGVASAFVILIDNSRSMISNSRLPIAKQAAIALVNSLALPSAFVAVGYFSSNVEVLSGNPVPDVTWLPSADPANFGLTPVPANIVNDIQNIPQSDNNTLFQGPGAAAISALTSLGLGTTVTYSTIVVLSDGGFQDGGAGLTRLLASVLNYTIVSLGLYAGGDGYSNLQQLASPGFFYNLSDSSDASNTCGTPTCIYDTAAQFPSQVCAGVPWGYALPTNPLESSILVDIEDDGGDSGGSGGTPTSWTYTASYTASCAGSTSGDPVTRSVTYTSTISQADAQVKATQQAQAAAGAALSCCTNAVQIVDDQPSTPFPACYKVSGFVGTVTSMDVVIGGFSHTAPGDVYMVLQGPQGQAVQLYAGNGAFVPCSAVQLTFVNGGAALPAHGSSTPIVNGTYAPSGGLLNCLGGTFTSASLSPDFSVFNGINPNGTWNLYVCDSQFLNVGQIESWSIQFNGVPTCACVGAPTNLAVHGGATGDLASVIPASFFNLDSSTQPAWDGTGLALTSTCVWSTGVLLATKSLGGAALYSAEVSLQNSDGYCYYELLIRGHFSGVVGGAFDPNQPLWRGWRSAGFGASPAGVYDYAPLLNGAGTNTLRAPGPLTLTLDAA